MNIYNCYFSGNSKPVDGGKMKYGIYIESNGQVFKDSKEYPADINNNINKAEALGLIHILKMLQNKEQTTINIFGDSMLIMNQLSGKIMQTNSLMEEAKNLLNNISLKNITYLNIITKEENQNAYELSKFEEDKVEIPSDYSVIGGGDLKLIELNNQKQISISINLNIPLNIFKGVEENFINVLDNELSRVKYYIDESLTKVSEYIGIDFNNNKDRYEISCGGMVENKSSDLWMLFMKLAEKSLKNRDEFFELNTNIEFSDNEIENIINLNMFDYHYDIEESKYIFRFK